MNIKFEPETYSISYNEKLIELVQQIGEKRMIQRMELEDKMVREALIALGWTPPWCYNMELAPKDGTMLLLKTKSLWDGYEHTHQGSWRVDEGLSGDKDPLWLDYSYDDFSMGYASVPLTPIAWKPILE